MFSTCRTNSLICLSEQRGEGGGNPWGRGLLFSLRTGSRSFSQCLNGYVLPAQGKNL